MIANNHWTVIDAPILNDDLLVAGVFNSPQCPSLFDCRGPARSLASPTGDTPVYARYAHQETGVRLGGYNVWEQTPGANFHGSLDDFHIYRGMLTAAQVAQLAQGAESCVDEEPGRP